MSDPNAYGPNAAYGQYPQQHGQPQQGQQPADPRQELMNYRFTAEELRVITECELESFYYRSLPFSLGLGTAALLGVRNGYLKPNVRFGPWPKVLALGFFGYIAGRFSYMKKCQEKIMALPNSRLAEIMRRRKGGSNWDLGSQEAGLALSLAPFQSATDSYSDEYSQPNSLNLDTSRPNYSGLDDVYHPTMEGNNDLNEELAIPTRKNTVTYDELRQKNRDEYAKTHQAPRQASPPPQAYYNQGIAPVGPPPPAAATPPIGSYSPTLDSDRRRNIRPRTDDDNGNSGPKNKYGDVWSE